MKSELREVVVAALKSGIVPDRPRSIYDDGQSRVYEASDGKTTLYLTADNGKVRPLIKYTSKLWKTIEERMAGLETALNSAYPDGLPGKSSNLRSKVLSSMLVVQKHYDGLHNQMDHGRKRKSYKTLPAERRDYLLWKSAPVKLGSEAWHAAGFLGSAIEVPEGGQVTVLRDNSQKAQAFHHVTHHSKPEEVTDYFVKNGYPHMPDVSSAVGQRFTIVRNCAVAPWNLDGIESDGPAVRGWGAALMYDAVSWALQLKSDAMYLLSASDNSHKFYEAIGMTAFGPDDNMMKGYGFSRANMEDFVKQYEAKYGKPDNS